MKSRYPPNRIESIAPLHRRERSCHYNYYGNSSAKIAISAIRAKKKLKKFGRYNKNAYLCNVKTSVLATPLSAGSKTLSPLLH